MRRISKPSRRWTQRRPRAPPTRRSCAAPRVEDRGQEPRQEQRRQDAARAPPPRKTGEWGGAFRAARWRAWRRRARAAMRRGRTAERAPSRSAIFERGGPNTRRGPFRIRGAAILIISNDPERPCPLGYPLPLPRGTWRLCGSSRTGGCVAGVYGHRARVFPIGDFFMVTFWARRLERPQPNAPGAEFPAPCPAV